MTEKDDKNASLSRREFLEGTGLTTLALSTGAFAGVASLAASDTEAKLAVGSAGKPYNILFVLTDQERYFDPESLPTGYSLPGRERLRREGTSFTNHQIATSVCSPSRSVIYTGQHIQHTKVFDNLGFPWSNELSLETPTIGAYLQEVGYYPAYLGKCHMLDALEEIEIGDAPDVNLDELNKVMQQYGFNDYVGVGDIIGNTMGGYKSDEFTTSTAVRWLRTEPPRLEDKPWFLAVNLVNPHDVMFYNTDARGAAPVQADGSAMALNREPAHALYQRRWSMPLPESRNEAWNQPGRPRAHYDYQVARGALVGQFPNDDARWQRLQDYYLNCIADCDRHVERILRELDELGLADNTIVVVTSDHGELAGAHQMHGKGATAYREQLQVPLWVRHPGHPDSAGTECQALTSHLDLAPTILGLAGVDAERRKSIAPKLHGHDIGGLMSSPASAPVDAVRKGALYNFNMWLFQDPDFLHQMIEGMRNGQDVAKLGLKLDLSRRGAIRSVTDGRYRFSRYYSPEQHNLPGSFEALLEYNDVELYDLETDPNELRNLAADRHTNGELLLVMNQKLNDIIRAEVGSDNGEFLPENKKGWAVTRFDL
jgi:arylsulfatase A-like enzyme